MKTIEQIIDHLQEDVDTVRYVPGSHPEGGVDVVWRIKAIEHLRAVLETDDERA